MDTALLDIETSTQTTDIKVENIVCTTTLCETLACHDINGLSDGITSLPYEEETSQSPSYNLAGQQVNSHYKGIVIQNGKKRMRK
jgi:TATA-box binding protein (TBP) (component of TFIID and TFIIIB)